VEAGSIPLATVGSSPIIFADDWGLIITGVARKYLQVACFFLYGSLAVTISKQFFSGVDETTGFMFALLAFAAVFIFRPFGAAFFGRLGDLVGRRYTFLMTIFLMGLATLTIGLLPGYAGIGIAAPILLITLRAAWLPSCEGEFARPFRRHPHWAWPDPPWNGECYRLSVTTARAAHGAVIVGLYLLATRLPAQSQVLVRNSADTGAVYNIVAVGDEIWLGAQNGAFRWDRRSNQAKRVEGDTGGVATIVPVGDEIWLGADNGAFRVERKSNQAVGVEDLTNQVIWIVPLGDGIWLFDLNGAYRVERKTNQAVRLGGDTGGFHSIKPIGDEIWVIAEKGVFRVDRKTDQLVPYDTGRGPSIVPVGDEIWLLSEKGAFRVDRKTNQAIPLAGDTGRAHSIVQVDNEIWVTAEKGVFRVDRKSDQAVPLAGDTVRAYPIVAVGEEIWVAAEKGVFRVDRKNYQAVPLAGGDTVRAVAIIPNGDDIWLFNGYRAFRVDRRNNQVVPLGGDTGRVLGIKLIGDDTWLLGEKGVFRVDRKSYQLVAYDTGRPSSIIPVGDDIWLLGEKGAFRVDRKSTQAVRLAGPTGANSIIPVGDEIWLAAPGGSGTDVFRVDRRTKIRVELDGSLQLWGITAWLEGITHPIVRYIDTQTGEQNYASSEAAPTLIYDSDSKKLLEREKDPKQWATMESNPLVELKAGWRSFHFSVRDGWGNEPEPQVIEGWVIPTWTLSALIPILSIGFCLVCLALAPYIRYCHMLLMNPFLRNWASFGLVPLFITVVPPLRRHILKRHCRALAQASRFESFAGGYVVPEVRFTSFEFAATLSKHKVIGLHGQSGIGKSAFLIYLAHQCASREAKHPLLRRLVPIFLDLSVAGGLNPKEMVRNALRKYGDLTDENLTEVLLDQGGFLFLFDGLNEVSERSALAIVQFADMHRNHSWSCLTAQVAMEELKKDSTLMAGSPLSDGKVKELVRKLAIDPKTKKEKFDPESLLNKFTDETYTIGHVPLQLELMVEMWETSRTLPRNLDGLYSYVVGPLVDKQAFSNQGDGDWPDVLGRLAFTMMDEKRPYDPKKDYLPDELKSQLVSKKLFLQRGEVLEFRHDRVRAYLAAKYFGSRWRAILTEQKTIVDANWDTMLEFHLAVDQNAHQTRDLLFLLLNKDMGAAIRLNAWGLQNRPKLFEDWQDDFSREIGHKVLHGFG
jgi:hypothetical protein